jgi:hypothetical protein
MLNQKVISDKKMIQHIKPIITRYYEDMFLKNAEDEKQDSNSYQELKKLYRRIKK